MLTFEKGIKRKYCYGGSGILDSIISAVTSNTAKNIATEVGKKAMTEAGNRAAQKVINKVLPEEKQSGGNNRPSNRAKLDKYLQQPKVKTLEEIIKEMNRN